MLLLSGGLDSAVNVAHARKHHTALQAVTFDYGQRAAAREITAAAQLCQHWSIPHDVMALPWLGALTTTALVNRQAALPHFTATDAALNDRGQTHQSAKSVWVPNRNGVFINIAAAMAEASGTEWIVTGFNAEEAATFPDNSVTFVERANAYLEYATLSHPKVISYTQAMSKVEIVRSAVTLDVPLEYCWPCYDNGPRWCGRCESCARFQRAVVAAGGDFSALAARAQTK